MQTLGSYDYGANIFDLAIYMHFFSDFFFLHNFKYPDTSVMVIQISCQRRKRNDSVLKTTDH